MRKINHSGFYWSKRWWGGSGISWTVCKSFAPCSRQITTPVAHQVFTGCIPFLLPNQQHRSTEGCNVYLASRSVVADTMKCTVIPRFTLTGPVYSHREVLHLSIKTANGHIRFTWKVVLKLASVWSFSTSDWYQLVVTWMVCSRFYTSWSQQTTKPSGNIDGNSGIRNCREML